MTPMKAYIKYMKLSFTARKLGAKKCQAKWEKKALAIFNANELKLECEDRMPATEINLTIGTTTCSHTNYTFTVVVINAKKEEELIDKSCLVSIKSVIDKSRTEQPNIKHDLREYVCKIKYGTLLLIKSKLNGVARNLYLRVGINNKAIIVKPYETKALKQSVVGNVGYVPSRYVSSGNYYDSWYEHRSFCFEPITDQLVQSPKEG